MEKERKKLNNACGQGYHDICKGLIDTMDWDKDRNEFISIPCECECHDDKVEEEVPIRGHF
jgi:hypothetical protein